VVWLHGEHDISTEAELTAALTLAMALDDADLVIDLSNVQFMGAATVGVIARSRAFLQDRQRSVTLRSPSTSARRVLHLCGLADLVDPGTAGALGTWVAVPATDRVDRVDGVDRVEQVVQKAQVERTMNMADGGGP
jgi:anti-anti-sigma factor